MKENAMKRLLLVWIIGMVGLMPSAFAQSSVNGTANATAAVIADITVTTAQNLQFGNATVNDPSKTVLATDTVNAAAFNVSGGANAPYSITLPGSANMTNGACGANCTIAVSSFTSNPASGTLSAGGTQTVYVGGTRAAILGTQVLGNYSGSFTVTFTYQ
jgi:hypothetical protein